ncbi:MAG: ChaN family lipoprotein [Rhodospirillales bacterium]
MGKWLAPLVGPVLAATVAATPAAGTAAEVCVPPGQWLGTARNRSIGHADLIAGMAKRPVVLLGEVHTSAEHHRWQLHTIAALHGRNPNMVLGFESFPRSVQPALDAWTRGDLSEERFLEESRWDEVWRIDAGLYMGLFQFARLHRIPMIALNVDRALIKRISKEGWPAVPVDARQGVDDPVPASDPYLDFLARVYRDHDDAKKELPDRDDPAFRHFVQAQITWDRAMAQALAAARRGGGRPLVVGIVGLGHTEYGWGIPRQLADLGVTGTAVLTPWDAGRACSELARQGGPAVADAVFGLAAHADPAAPQRPKLGVLIGDGDGGVRVKKVTEGSVAEAAGLAPDDLIREAAGVAVYRTSDLIAIVRRQAPGTWLPLRVMRGAETVDIVARFPPTP